MKERHAAMLQKGIVSAVLHGIIIAVGVATVFPFFWMLSTSFKSGGGIFTYPPQWLPVAPTFEWYAKLVSEVDIILHFQNSFIISVSITLSNIFLCSMAGYAFAKLQFKGRDGLFRFLLTTMMVPAQLTMIPIFLLLKNLGLLNTYMGVIITGAVNVFGIFLIRQYMSSLPNDLMESARIDGCSEFRIYWSVILPLCKPVLATIGIFSFMGSWNDFLWPLIVMLREERYTLPVALANMNGQHPTEFGLLMAAAVVVVTPVILLFLFAQKYVIQGFATSGIKE